MYEEYDDQYLQVPEPPSASRKSEPPEAPFVYPSAPYPPASGFAAPSPWQQGAGVEPTPAAQGESGPSLLGAFSALIQRMHPADQVSRDPSERTLEPERTSLSRSRDPDRNSRDVRESRGGGGGVHRPYGSRGDGFDGMQQLPANLPLPAPMPPAGANTSRASEGRQVVEPGNPMYRTNSSPEVAAGGGFWGGGFLQRRSRGASAPPGSRTAGAEGSYSASASSTTAPPPPVEPVAPAAEPRPPSPTPAPPPVPTEEPVPSSHASVGWLFGAGNGNADASDTDAGGVWPFGGLGAGLGSGLGAGLGLGQLFNWADDDMPEYPSDEPAHRKEPEPGAGLEEASRAATAAPVVFEDPPVAVETSARWPARSDPELTGMGAAVQPRPGVAEEPRRGRLRALQGTAPASLRDAVAHRATSFASWYVAKGPARCPCCCATLALVIFAVVIGLGMLLKPIEIETSFDSFMKTSTNSSTLRDTFEAAMESRTQARRLQGALLYKQFDLYIAYEVTGSSASVFDHEVLQRISAFEADLRSKASWKALCEQANVENLRRLCDPGLSLATYGLPSLQMEVGKIVPSNMAFDGQGRDAVPLDTTLRLLQQYNLQAIVLPTSYDAANPLSTKVCRTVLRWQLYCCTSTDPASVQLGVVERLNEEWDTFVKDTALPLLQDASDGDSGLKVYFGGTGVEEIEVMDTLWGDIRLAFASMVFVLCYLTFHTQSLFLGILGIIIVVMAVPFSYVFFALLANTTTMTIASFLSLFLVVGLGSDVIFVYTDFWRDAPKYAGTVEIDQVTWTLLNAGKASFATTFTTALSFFANLASVLRPLREFGMFMGLCVVFVWVLVTIVYLPLCVVDERWFSRCRLRCDRSWRRPSRPSSPQPVMHRTLSSRSHCGFFSTTTRIVRSYARLIVFAWILLFLASIGLAVTQAETDTGVPNIFPGDHNQNRGKELLERFNSASEVVDPNFAAPPAEAAICSESSFQITDRTSCSLFWCEVNTLEQWSPDGTCQCYRQDKGASTCDVNGATATAVQRFVGTSQLNAADLNGAVGDHLVSDAVAGLSFPPDNSRAAFMSQAAMAPLLLEEWETGDTMLKPMTELQATLQRANTQASCGFNEICFCGTYVCKLAADFQRVNDITLSSLTPLSGGRLLSGWTVASDQRATVDVVFGIRVIETNPLLGQPDMDSRWEFLDSFVPSQPWAQRNMYYFCEDLPESLRAVQKNCWIQDFRNWLVQRNERFPTLQENFDNLLNQFAAGGLTGVASSKDFLWVRDGMLKASYMAFSVDVYKYADTDTAIEYMEMWDGHITTWNDEASRFARGAWHTSQLWVRAEAQRELISSTVTTLLIVLGLAFLGMLVFTVDLVLALFVVLSTIGVLCFLAFFIIVLMAWPIGPIEVIALIVFIGYAVTYSLHVAHKYGGRAALSGDKPSSEMSENSVIRYQRTNFALGSIGTAALGSAATTVGCAVFLVFCTLTIFQKLGGVVLAVTVMSIVTALAPLPALLLIMGPVHPGRRWMLRPSDFQGLTDAAMRCCRWRPAFWTADKAGAGDKPRRDENRHDVGGTARREPPPEGAGFSHPTPAGGVRTMHQQAHPAGMRPSFDGFSDQGMQDIASEKTWKLVQDSPRKHAALPQPQPGRSAKKEAEVEEVRLSVGGFDIGEESKMGEIWALEPAGKPSTTASGRPIRPGAHAVKVGAAKLSPEQQRRDRQAAAAEAAKPDKGKVRVLDDHGSEARQPGGGRTR